MKGEITIDERPLVLVAEDNESSFKLIKAIIGKKCELHWGQTGEEAVRLFNMYRQETKLILMDIKMPVMNGLEAVKIIRGTCKEIPIVIQTAYAFRSDREEALNAGADAVLVKPVSLELLRDTLSKYIPGIVW
ncbi:response regulator [Bacteroides pyogenes]|uniref:response regulator n=1 Tax=Bacteroides pyogenes TaxID=310300 RepID=UPI002A836908|nr:response regulator [Bacteroides pyogenes]MDY4250694.1 response regulator [Bacteroides pyogenes]